MVSVNTVILGGHLGGVPEEKRTAAGKLLCSFRLATNRWEARAEEEVTDWHTVVAFERVAETCVKHLRKGSPVLVEGRLVVRQWDGADGKKSSRCEVVANRVTFLGSRPAGEERHESAGAPTLARREAGEAAQTVPF